MLIKYTSGMSNLEENIIWIVSIFFSDVAIYYRTIIYTKQNFY